MDRKWSLILVIFSVVLALVTLVSAIPQTFNINGKLTDTSNSPLSGTYNFNFSIYSAVSGGTHLWTSNAMSVTTDSNGIYNVEVFDDRPIYSEEHFEHPKVLITLREGLFDVILSSVNLEFADQYYFGTMNYTTALWVDGSI